MDHKEISNIFHASSSSDRYAEADRIAAERRSSPSSFDVGLDSPAGPMFVSMPTETIVLYERVLRTERKASAMMRSVPGIAQAALVRGLVLDEVVSTNAIEDIHSTRKQVEDALAAQRVDSVVVKRFRELAHLYLGLGSSSARMPKTPEDVRDIYNLVTDGEIPAEKMPDGELFRAHGVDIVAGGAKVLHSGLLPESRIREAIESMLALVSRDDVPEVIAAIASHFMFEYAHPFYDGNGRTGRYLLALFLNEALSVPTVLSLSRTIAENRDVYYRAFRSAQDPMNKGELTFFVHDMLSLVRIAQTGVIAGIERSTRALNLVDENLDSFASSSGLTDKESAVVFALAQYELFGLSGTVGVDEVSQVIGVGRQMSRRHLARLEASGAVSKVSARPLRFALSDDARRGLGMEGAE